uniref:Uncharacterized protein n=1 Tax=Myoviridae sp. ct89I2 TaxID=2827662 RepID=A0A8S5TCG1_9CAUD|nr:MAG TPA: hypothetical protein [Myoviridae sp. ct89I2]
MNKEETEATISRIKKYIELTNVPQEVMRRYPLFFDEINEIMRCSKSEGMMEAFKLAFNLGFCKGYRAGNVKRVKERTVK